MTNLSGSIQQQVAPLYSLRNWIEYDFKQVKNELGWADFRLTAYESIERWWELVLSAYLLVSLQANYFRLETIKAEQPIHFSSQSEEAAQPAFEQHPCWEPGTNWKSALNNLRLIVQPLTCYYLIKAWLQVFKIPGLSRGMHQLTQLMDDFQGFPLQELMAQDGQQAVA